MAEREVRRVAHGENIIERVFGGDLAEHIRSSMAAEQVDQRDDVGAASRWRPHGGIVRRCKADRQTIAQRFRRQPRQCPPQRAGADLGGAAAAAHVNPGLTLPASSGGGLHANKAGSSVHVHPAAQADPILDPPDPRALDLELAARRQGYRSPVEINARCRRCGQPRPRETPGGVAGEVSRQRRSARTA